MRFDYIIESPCETPEGGSNSTTTTSAEVTTTTST